MKGFIHQIGRYIKKSPEARCERGGEVINKKVTAAFQAGGQH